MAAVSKPKDAPPAPLDAPEPRPQLPADEPGAPAGEELPPLPVSKPTGPIPRVISQNERSPGGTLKRFKVRCNNYHPMGMFRYILAKTRLEATTHYLKVQGIADTIDRLKSNGVAVEAPDLFVTELPD